MPATPQPDAMVIGVCTYNRGPKIRRTLEAIAALDRRGGRVTRVIVIDNNCTDTTPDIVRDFAAAITSIPITLIRETTQGLAAARKRVFAETTEPLIAFLDDDCLPAPNWAAAMLSRMDAHDRIGAAGGRVDLVWEQPPSPLALRMARNLAQQDWGPRPRRIGADEYLVGAAIVLRRSAILASGVLDRGELMGRTGGKLTSGEDSEIGIRLRHAGYELWYEPAAVCGHLIPPERTTREYLLRLVGALSQSEPWLHWLSAGKPGEEWVLGRMARARRRLLKTRLLEWRPMQRTIRVAERTGRLAGWEQVLARVRDDATRGAGS